MLGLPPQLAGGVLAIAAALAGPVAAAVGGRPVPTSGAGVAPGWLGSRWRGARSNTNTTTPRGAPPPPCAADFDFDHDDGAPASTAGSAAVPVSAGPARVVKGRRVGLCVPACAGGESGRWAGDVIFATAVSNNGSSRARGNFVQRTPWAETDVKAHGGRPEGEAGSLYFTTTVLYLASLVAAHTAYHWGLFPGAKRTTRGCFGIEPALVSGHLIGWMSTMLVVYDRRSSSEGEVHPERGPWAQAAYSSLPLFFLCMTTCGYHSVRRISEVYCQKPLDGRRLSWRWFMTADTIWVASFSVRWMVAAALCASGVGPGLHPAVPVALSVLLLAPLVVYKMRHALSSAPAVVTSVGLLWMLLGDMASGSEWALATFIASMGQVYSYIRWARAAAQMWKRKKQAELEQKRHAWTHSPGRLQRLSPTLDRARGAARAAAHALQNRIPPRARAVAHAIRERVLDIEGDSLPAMAMYAWHITSAYILFRLTRKLDVFYGHLHGPSGQSAELAWSNFL